uniref:ABC-2 type transporter domain-containing protein n=1 Tax=Strigamia maritima TaxID=126957 RepID=T1J8M4_STRMM
MTDEMNTTTVTEKSFFISTVSNEPAAALILALGSFLPTMFTCGLCLNNTCTSIFLNFLKIINNVAGCLWPIEGMPALLQTLTQLQPMTLATAAERYILSYGKDITFPPVWISFLATIAWSLFFIILSVLVLRYKK